MASSQRQLQPLRRDQREPPLIRPSRQYSKILRLLLFLSAACFFWGCAAEGPPRPPRIQRPTKVTDLAVAQAGQTLRLSFKAPLRAMDGRRLTKPISVEIFRQVTPPGESLPNVFVGVKPWVSISPRDLARYQHEQEIVYEDRLPSQEFDRSVGDTFSFMVVTLTRGFRGRPRPSDPSNVARMKLLNVSPPVQDLQVTQSPRSLNLRWAAPTQSLTGGSLPPLVGYRIYRREETHSASTAKLVAETQKPSFFDTDFQYDQTYSYTVRAVFEKDGYTAETADSAPANITPRDIFPPNAPQGLTAVFTGRSVQLIWKPALAPDIAGYNVYRQIQGQSPERLNQGLLRTPVFSDSSIVEGRQYTYWVTTVNLVHHESLPSQKVTLKTK